MDKEKKFRQSQDFSSDMEQHVYNSARTLAKENGSAGLSAYIDFMNGNGTMPEGVTLTKERFIQILNIAYQDYWGIMFDPFGINSGKPQTE